MHLFGILLGKSQGIISPVKNPSNFKVVIKIKIRWEIENWIIFDVCLLFRISSVFEIIF